MELGRVREIGRASWNPIGLAGPPATPADAYDASLPETIRRIGRGDPLPTVASCLVAVKRGDMGLRALATARALGDALRAAALDHRRRRAGA